MNIQHSRSLLDVRLVEKHDHLPPDRLPSGVMLKTTRTIEDKNIPSQGVTGFNQLVIKLQLIFDIAFCDYE